MKSNTLSKKINVRIWDDYFEKEVIVKGTKTTFSNPILWNSIQYKSFHVTFMKDQQEIVIRIGTQKIDESDLSQIADIFGITDFQINRTRKNYVYLCFGPRSFWWVNESTIYKSKICKLNYVQKIYCTGFTEIPVENSEPNFILHTIFEGELGSN